MSETALVAMSGGVDSSVAAALMIEQGFKCTGVTLKLFQEKIGAIAAAGNTALPGFDDAQKAAGFLGIDHCFLDFSGEFDKYVIRHFIETYEQGATPNPCIECNRHIKFNLALFQKKLLETSLQRLEAPLQKLEAPLQKLETSLQKLEAPLRSTLSQAALLATGHYARVIYDAASGRYLLQKAADDSKDQSYVLYNLNQQQLGRVRFPLGGLLKNDVRRIAGEKKLVNAKKSESQDICFVPDGDYARFIEEYTGKEYPPGDILDSDGRVIGRHRGIIRCTIGQRRGLGVAANTPVYVTAKSAADNTVTLGQDAALFKKSLIAKSINLITCADLKKPVRVMVKTRYLQTAQSAVAEQTGEDSLLIEFDKPQRAITPGQAAVMYDGDIVVGGGTIT